MFIFMAVQLSSGVICEGVCVYMCVHVSVCLLCHIFMSCKDNLVLCQRVNQYGAYFLHVCKFCQVTQYGDLK